MQTTFFATDKDLLEIVQWFFDVPGAMLFEPASRPGLPNRQFTSVEDVAELFQEPGRYLAAWIESTGARPVPRDINFEPSTQSRFGGSGRNNLESPSIFRIFRNNNQNGCLASSYFTCWNEKGARQRSIYSAELLDQVDWKAVRLLEGHLRRKLSKTSPAKLGSHPIMANAFDELRQGRISLWGWGSACSFTSPLITVLRPHLESA